MVQGERDRGVLQFSAKTCTSSSNTDKIGGNLPGVHYIRDDADANSLISSLEKAKKLLLLVVVILAWKQQQLGGILILLSYFLKSEDHLMTRLFTPFLAQKYEDLYRDYVVKFVKVDGLFRTSVPGIFAIGDVAAFPLKIYNRSTRVEHVDHARRSAQHCVEALLTAHTDTYDYLPHFYSRVFEYEGSPRKVWWQFFGDNVGETVEVGKFDPKVATFWINSGIQTAS